jgi:hypothetical protein
MRKSLLVTSVAALIGATFLVGCAADANDAAEESGPVTCHDPAKLPATAARLDVTLKEWSVQLSSPTVKAGAVNIVAKNAGTMTHELVIFRGASYKALPQNADGSVNEDEISRADTIGEISEFDAGTTCGRSYELAPGTYVLLCNIVMGDVIHAKKGMVTTLTVV